MYLSHFGLDEAPFRITPHTEFFFDGANRGATLEALLYAITHDEGIVKVSGEVGSGKTMLCRVLMERLPKQVEIIYLSNPSLARDEILRAIADELKVDVDANRATVVLRALQEHLIKVHAQGHQVVVLIDEAHAMPLETLEEIRLLSNLETSRHKLLQIVLFGQPELDENLNIPQMRQLKERITHSFRLEPLIRDDIAQYLMFRMRAAGYRGPDIFTKAAIRDLARASEGLTRRINILADKALLAAFSENTHEVTAKHVKAAIRDSEFHSAPRRSRTLWMVLAAVMAGIAIGAFSLRYFEPTSSPSAAPAPRAATSGPAASPVLAQPAATGDPATPVTANTSAATAAAPATAPPVTAVTAPVTPPVAAPTPAHATAPATAPGNPPHAVANTASGQPAAQANGKVPEAPPVQVAAAKGASAASVSPATATAKAAQPMAPAARQQAPQAAAVAAPVVTAQSAANDGATLETAGPLTHARMAATAAWLKDAPGREFAIQVMTVSTGNQRELEAFLARADKLTGLNNIYVYQTRVKGQSRSGLAVVYGSYASREKVRETIAQFPAEIRTYLPYLRTVGGIRREISERDALAGGRT